MNTLNLFKTPSKPISFRQFLPYSLAIFFIIAWWSAAFLGEGEGYITILPPEQTARATEEFPLHITDRAQLREALNGNFNLMHDLFSKWEVDARFYETQNIPGASWIGFEKSLRFHSLMRTLTQKDTRRSIRLLPQTYAAAAILFALTTPSEIIAIPKGMRNGNAILTSDLTAQIPLDIDRLNSEVIAQEHPDLAFIAPYSNPQTVETLQRQGIQLLSIEPLHSEKGVLQNIERIGNAIDRTQESEILTLFIEASMANSDNRVAYLKHIGADVPTKFAVLQYYSNFKTPCERTLTRKLLHRLEKFELQFYDPAAVNQDQWAAYVSMEDLIQYDPDCLIISCGMKTEQLILDKNVQELKACKNSLIFTIDDEVQLSLTQHIALAYFDLAESVAKSIK
ncbi:MAG: ABC transporter substrate-binding protein [Waddliaceae bacterium]